MIGLGGGVVRLLQLECVPGLTTGEGDGESVRCFLAVRDSGEDLLEGGRAKSCTGEC